MSVTFHNRKILITGATSGIGLSLARILAEEGAELMLAGRKQPNHPNLHNLLKRNNVRYCQCDLSNAKSVEDLRKACEEAGWSALDHLILNAGVGYIGEIEDQTPEAIEQMIDVNLKLPLLLATAFFPHLEKADGSVVFIGSTASGRTTPHYATYTATKTGLSDLVRNLRNEWQSRVLVQEVLPGPTRTDFHAKAGMDRPPLQFLYMASDEVAKGVLTALRRGTKTKKYGFPSLLFFAIKRKLLGDGK